jgi:hypothetical protein
MPLDLPLLLGSGRLYASGLGIVLYSDELRQALLAAESEADRSAVYDRALMEGRAVRIATGSPQLYYECLFSNQSLPGTAPIVAQTTFGLRIDGPSLGLCDGYAELDWSDRGYQHESVTVSAGLFRVDACYLTGSRQPEDDMLLFFRLTAVSALADLPSGTVELLFEP